MSGKSLGILAIVAAVLVGVAVFLSNRQPPAIQGINAPMFPDFETDINQASQVTITSPGSAVEINRKDNVWQIKQKGGYPATFHQVRQLLVGIAELTRIEPKTRNPKLYADIGVQDVGKKGSKATLIEVRDARGGTMAALLVGTERANRGNAATREYFVRRPDHRQSWLVSGNLILNASPKAWLKTQLLDIASKRIRKVTVKHPDGPQVTVYKDSPGAADYRLAGVPKDAKIKSAFTVNEIANTMGRLSVDDVFQPRDLHLADQPSLVATLETFDGLRLTLKAFNQLSGHTPSYVKLSAAYDAPLRGKAPADAKTAAQVKQEAAALDNAFKPWIYKLPPFQIGNIDKKPVDLVNEPKAAPRHPHRKPRK